MIVSAIFEIKMKTFDDTTSDSISQTINFDLLLALDTPMVSALP